MPAPPRTPWRSLLAHADSIAGLAALARALGFGAPSPLDAGTRQALGIPDDMNEIHVAEGPGATRAVLVAAGERRGARDQAQRLATRLSSRAPHLLWLACLATPESGRVTVAAWSSQRLPPRLAALVVDRDHVLASDVETMAALGATTPGNDLLRHARWLEILGREAISRRFYAALERLVFALADDVPPTLAAEERREIALLNVSRLLFLAFLETKGWLDADRDFLARVFDDCMSRGGAFHRRVLEPLFFGTLNTRLRQRAPAARAFGRIPFLNGGLFHRSPLERRGRSLVFPDQAWGAVYDELLLRYRFTAHEESAEWSETAVDPEMLGRAFESLMAACERRDSGAYFTPFSLVERGTEAALDALLESEGFSETDRQQLLAAEGATPDPTVGTRLRRVLSDVRLLDPACGSGAFLIHALDRLTRLWQLAGDGAASPAIRRRVLTQSIFGVDVNPMAVWLCELRLWLAVVLDDTADDPLRVPPLPNLDHNIRCGDALAGGDFSGGGAPGADRLQRLRLRYVRATGPRKRSLARALERGERANLRLWLEAQLEQLTEQRRVLLQVARGRDLFGARRGALAAEREALRSLRERVREVRARLRSLEKGGAVPFAFAAHFPEVAGRGGFDVVIGNPPWVRLHRIPPAARERMRREFRVFRNAAWDDGAREARAGSGFGAQVDVAALFVERGLTLCRRGGVLSLLVPAKLWRSLAGGGVRRLLAEQAALRVIEDWSDAPPAFDAATYPSLVVASRADGMGDGMGDALVRVHRGRLSIGWRAVPGALPLDESPGAPWLTLPPDARAAFDRLARDGVALARSGLGHPTLGVKCGLNEAFLVRQVRSAGRTVQVSVGGRTGEVEAACLRPVLRGEMLRPWRRAEGAESLVYPCDEAGRVLPVLPPGARAWLVAWRSALARRADARGARAWWALFRTESAVNDRPRVVWADLARAPQALVLAAGDRTVALNSCYVLRARDLTDALALAALLNGPLAAAWLGALAEPARGGYRRFMAWTMARLPVPDDWARAREILAPLGARGCQGDAPTRAELLEAALEAYRCRLKSMAPLLSWMSR